MTETPPKPKSDMDEYYERSRRPLITQPTSRAGRIGCGMLVVIWFIVLTLPFAMLWLATGRNITLSRGGDAPLTSQHPRLRVQLVMESDFRGLQISRNGVLTNEDTLFCYDQSVNYLLWENRGDEDINISREICYERDTIDNEWQPLSVDEDN